MEKRFFKQFNLFFIYLGFWGFGFLGLGIGLGLGLGFGFRSYVGSLRLCVVKDGGGAEAVNLVHFLSRQAEAEGVGLVRVRAMVTVRVRVRVRVGVRVAEGVGLVVEQHA